MEKWTLYKNDRIPNDCYEVISTVVNNDGTMIILEGEKYQINIQFIYTEVVMVCDEGRRIETYLSREELKDYRIDFIGNPIYEVTNSELDKWIEKQSLEIFDSYNHYTVITQNDIIDILTRDIPKIKIKRVS